MATGEYTTVVQRVNKKRDKKNWQNKTKSEMKTEQSAWGWPNNHGRVPSQSDAPAPIPRGHKCF